MAYSTQRALSDGTLREILLTIGFIDRTDINVFLDDLPMTETGAADPSDITYEWITNNLIRFSEDIPDGSEVLIQRATQLGTVLNVFSAGASFDDPTMDENFLQLLYIAQEAREGSSLAEVFQDIDMHGYRLNNLGVATEPGQAVPLQQMQSESTWAYQSRVAAEAAAATAVSARNAAQLSESNAAGSASAAAGSASAASASAANAAASAATAVTNRNQSLTFRNEAEGFRDEAEGFRDDAATSAAEAAGYAAGVNLPSALGHGGEYLRQRVDEGGFEYRTSAQTRADLGLGTAATQNVGQSGAAIPLLSQANTWARPQSISGQASDSVLLSLERASSLNASLAFRLGGAGAYTHLGMGPNTPGELYIGTSADLGATGNKVYHTGNISSASVAHAETAAGLGVGQSWQNLTSNRVLGTTYTNTTGKVIFVSVSIEGVGTGGGRLRFYTAGVGRGFATTPGMGAASVCIPVMPGDTYGAEIISGAASLVNWSEYR